MLDGAGSWVFGELLFWAGLMGQRGSAFCGTVVSSSKKSKKHRERQDDRSLQDEKEGACLFILIGITPSKAVMPLKHREVTRWGN